MKKKELLKLAEKEGWNYISEYQKLSEDFIKEFQDKVDWYWISLNQKLSYNFIDEFQDKLNWEVLKERKLSKTIQMGFYEKLG